MNNNQIVVPYDTTLRDGNQAGGVTFSVDDKLKITEEMSRLGFPYIEGGYPASNPTDREFFKRIRDININPFTRIAAFGSTRRKNVSAEDDSNIRALIEAKTPVVTIFGKSYTTHVEVELKTSKAENRRMIQDSVSYLKSYGGSGVQVVYDAEHFFDGYAKNKEYALQTLEEAVNGGADWIVLCDTNGGFDFLNLAEIVREVKVEFPNIKLGIHAHNDGEMAVANTLAAVFKGAEMVQGTVNGYGERTGNANLISVLANLAKYGYKFEGDFDIRNLTQLSRFVDETANLIPNPRQPYVSRFAFAHKGHIPAVMKDTTLYEHVPPESVGNNRVFLISNQSGRAVFADYGDSKDDPLVAEIARRVKEAEHRGYEFETANGSLELLIEDAKGIKPVLFNLEEYRVETRTRLGDDGKSYTDTNATVRLRVNGDVVTEMEYGDGPVNALNRALKTALVRKYPELKDVHLTDYKVRILPEHKGTASKVRVLMQSSCGTENFGTIGVDENIIQASWEALVDSLVYAWMIKANRKLN